MNKKVRKLFLPKNLQKTTENTSCTPDISQFNIVSEAEMLIENYIKSMGYKTQAKNKTKKNMVLAFTLIFSAVAISSFVVFHLL